MHLIHRLVTRQVGFGYEKSSPIPVEMQWGQQRYLASLRCACDREFEFRRIGNVGPGPDEHIVDLFDLRCGTGRHEVRLYLDMYHVGEPEGTPYGLRRVPPEEPRGGGASALNSSGRTGSIGIMYVPRLRVPVPAGWFAKESITVIAADGQANVIASSEPLDPVIDTTRYAEIQGDLLRREFASYHEDSYEAELVFGGRPGFIRKFRWTPPDGTPVVQLQLYYAAGGRGYTATATISAGQFSRLEAVLLEVLRGIVIVEHSQPG